MKIIKLITIILCICVLIISAVSCAPTINEELIDSARTYKCNYHTTSYKTKISTTINDEKVTISGKLFTFKTDSLVMKNSKKNIIAKADDSYNLITQDDHAIIVDGIFEIAIHGNFSLIGNSYDLHNENGDKIGKAKFNEICTSGAIYDSLDNTVATYSK